MIAYTEKTQALASRILICKLYFQQFICGSYKFIHAKYIANTHDKRKGNTAMSLITPESTYE